MNERISSYGDERTANNVMRHEYRILSDEEKMTMKEIKDLGVEMVSVVERIARILGRQERKDWPYELRLAHERTEEAVMWAVKFITGDHT